MSGFARSAPGLPMISRNYPESWGENQIIAAAIEAELQRFSSSKNKYTWSGHVDGSVRVRSYVGLQTMSVSAEGCVVQDFTLANETEVKICDFSKADLKLHDGELTLSFKSFPDLVTKMERRFGVWSDDWDDAWG